MSNTNVVCTNTIDGLLDLSVSPFDTCDRCGPAVSAAIKIAAGDGALTFCAHCARTRAGVHNFYIADNYKTPDPEPVSSGACTADV